MKTRIIGLGNSILTDDGVGIYTVREVSRRLSEGDRNPEVDVIETEVAGFALMEIMAGWERIILVDSIQFGGLLPGSVIRISPDDLHTSLRIRSIHEIDLPTVLELGRRLGLEMPTAITIFGIQAEDPYTLGERLTESVTIGMKEAVERVLEEVHAPI
jgi:hydrogenase maturation protease